VYVGYSRRLKWSEYFKLVRKLLFKIEKATRKSAEIAAVKKDGEVEKTVTKCLCKVLEGFNEECVPDAILTIEKKA